MKLMAALPLVVVLVSICGAPAPASNSTVSGVVFFDANRNGIRDSCDEPLGGKGIVVISSNGTEITARSDDDGNFSLRQVTGGEVLVTLQGAKDSIWPITTRGDKNQAGVVLTIKGFETIRGVELGVASEEPYPINERVVLGIIFHDVDGDGGIDPNECGWPGTAAVLRDPSGGGQDGGSNGVFAFRNAPAKAEVTAFFNTQPPTRVDGTTIAETTPPRDGKCANTAIPQTRYSDLLTHAEIGLRETKATGQIVGVVFDDKDGNGQRNTEEPPVERVRVTANYENTLCPFLGERPWAISDPDGRFTLDGLLPEEYGLSWFGSHTPDGGQIILTDPYISMPVSLDSTRPAYIELPVETRLASFITPVVFDDDNGNGLRDDDEPQLPLAACASPDMTGLAGDSSFRLPYSGCSDPAGAGDVRIGPLLHAVYRVSVATDQLVWGQTGADAAVELAEGETKTVELAVDVVEAGEQVLDPAAAEALAFDICFRDDDWVAPSFQQGYDPTQGAYKAWSITEQEARRMYERRVYQAYPGFEDRSPYIWAAIAGRLRERVPTDCADRTVHDQFGSPIQYDELFTLVGYEPVEVLRSANVTQVRVVDHGIGLYGLGFGAEGAIGTNPGIEPTILFVDMSSRPLLLCRADDCRLPDDS